MACFVAGKLKNPGRTAAYSSHHHGSRTEEDEAQTPGSSTVSGEARLVGLREVRSIGEPPTMQSHWEYEESSARRPASHPA